MPDPLYDVVFAGKILEDKKSTEVRSKIGKIFQARGSVLDRLFSGTPVKVKSGVDQDTAVKYRVAFHNAGAVVEITPSDPSVPAAMTLLPPKTGSLIDCAPRVQAVPLPDISNLVLSPEGTDLDGSKPDTALAIDTDSLTLSPARSGTLEDCHVPIDSVPSPNIDHLRLVKQVAADS